MVWNGIKEKPHRLDESLYRGFVQCSFTAKLKPRDRFFVNDQVVHEHESILLEALDHMDCLATLYVFMPDHLHVVIESTSDESDTRACMTRFKQRSACSLSKHTKSFRWQKDFFDRILRDEKEARRHLNYILMNPVRGRLVESWKDYPYWGSTKYSRAGLMMGVKELVR